MREAGVVVPPLSRAMAPWLLVLQFQSTFTFVKIIAQLRLDSVSTCLCNDEISLGKKVVSRDTRLCAAGLLFGLASAAHRAGVLLLFSLLPVHAKLLTKPGFIDAHQLS